MHFNFWKWEGTGNDFVLFDRRAWPELPDVGEIQRLCDRSKGVGADGVIFFQPVSDLDATGVATDWEMDYVNADGSRSFCGNGSRALFSFLRSKGWMPQIGGVLHACDGAHAVRWNPVLDEPGVELRPVRAPKQIPSLMGGERAHFVNTGSPASYRMGGRIEVVRCDGTWSSNPKCSGICTGWDQCGFCLNCRRGNVGNENVRARSGE